MVKIDVKDWPDNVHGGERVMTRLRPWTWNRPLVVRLAWWWARYLSLSREVLWKVVVWDSFFLKISGRRIRVLSWDSPTGRTAAPAYVRAGFCLWAGRSSGRFSSLSVRTVFCRASTCHSFFHTTGSRRLFSCFLRANHLSPSPVTGLRRAFNQTNPTYCRQGT